MVCFRKEDFLLRTLPAVGALLLSACTLSQAQEEVPAVITHPTPASRAELSRAVSEALQSTPVTLADDALTNTSSLFIERTPRRDAAGRLLNGRELRRPEKFRLVKQGDQCVLVHENSAARRRLEAVSCEAEP